MDTIPTPQIKLSDSVSPCDFDEHRVWDLPKPTGSTLGVGSGFLFLLCNEDYTKTFDCVDHNKLWKILQEMEFQITLPASWEICMQFKKQQLERDMEQQTGCKLGKEYMKAVISHSAYLTYMQSTSW